MGVAEETIHASTVAIGGRAVLIMGPSGAGKSDLALRLIDRGGVLVSDDYTTVAQQGDTLVAMPPVRIAGQIEVRGIGIVRTPHLESATVALAVLLAAEDERLPEPRTIEISGIAVPAIVIDPRPASAPIKVEVFLGGATA